MSRINATTITSLSGAAPTFTNGAIVTGVITATGAVVTGGTTLIGSATTTGTASQPLQVTGGAYVSGSVGIGTTNPLAPLHVNFSSYHGISGNALLRLVGVGSATYIQSGITATSGSSAPLIFTNIFATNEWARFTSSGNLGIGTTNPLSRLEVDGGESRFGGVIETVSTATTYSSATGALVLEMDVRQATTYTYTIPTGANIGIVSFKNMPAPTGNSSGTTITCILTQNAAGTGNTTLTTGIGTNCTVVGYENNAAVAGISTRALVGSGTTLTLSTTASDRDFVSFFVHYTGASNTTASSYQVYATKNGGFR
jgi:hypothetical protein